MLSEIGVAWLRIYNPGQAEVAYRKVLEIQQAEVGPMHELALETTLKLARTLEAQGKPVEAVKRLEPFYEPLKTSDRLECMLGKFYRSRLARDYLDSHQPDKTIALLERLLEKKRALPRA